MIQGGGVKLYELHILDRTLGAIDHGDAVARGDEWIGSGLIDGSACRTSPPNKIYFRYYETRLFAGEKPLAQDLSSPARIHRFHSTYLNYTPILFVLSKKIFKPPTKKVPLVQV